MRGVVTEEEMLICTEKAEGKSIIDICKSTGIDEGEVRRVLKDNKKVIKELRRQLREHRTNQYEKLFKKSITALKDILGTPHEIDVYDKEGNKTGIKIDTNILKLKKEIASELLESLNIKKSSKKGGGINIVQKMQAANISRNNNRENKMIEMERNEIKQLLDDCRSTPREIKKIEGSLN